MSTHMPIELMCQKLDKTNARLDELSQRMRLVEANLNLDKYTSLSITGKGNLTVKTCNYLNINFSQ